MDRVRASMWQTARRRVQQTIQHLSRGEEQPLGTLITDFTDSVRRARSVAEAIAVALVGLQDRMEASSILLLEKGANGEYRCRDFSIAVDGVLMKRLRGSPHPLTLSQEHFDTWRRWARELKPAYLAEIDALAATGAQVAVPLRTKTDIVGVLLLGAPIGREHYTDAQQQFLSNSGELFALLLENTRLIDRAVEQEKLRRDMAMAAEVQKRLLPPRPPRSTGATFAAFTLPARTVGGDYYDFLDLGDGRVGIAVADVSGKGFPAALLMSVVQASLRVIATDRCLPLSQLCAKMNGFLYESTEMNRYATFFYAQIEEDGRRLRYVNAGHNPPYLVREDDGDPGLIELFTGGTALGLFPETTYDEGVIDLRPHDVLVAFTDGVTDALNPEGDEFGHERLEAVLRSAAGSSAEDIAARLADRVRTWMGGAEQHDDLTFVVVTVGPR